MATHDTALTPPEVELIEAEQDLLAACREIYDNPLWPTEVRRLAFNIASLVDRIRFSSFMLEPRDDS